MGRRIAAVAVLAGAALAAPANAFEGELGQNHTDAPVTCDHPPLSARLATHDPTSFADDPGVVLAPYRKVVFTDVRVTLRTKTRLVASADLERLSTSGTVLRLTRPGGGPISVPAGSARITVVGNRNACSNKRQRVSRSWSFARPSLPVRAAPATTFVEDARRGLRLYLRSVGGRVSTNVTARVLDGKDRTVAHGSAGRLADGVILDLGAAPRLTSGTYRLRLSGRAEGAKRTSTWTVPLVFASRGSAGSPPIDADAGLAEQRPSVNWSNGRVSGRDQAGFVAPGIGFGELVCGRQQQHVRFHPNDLGRETSMMLWAYKQWEKRYDEKSIRESVHTQFGGPDFQEGLNKFSPPEHFSTGEYEGLIVDRGLHEKPFGAELAPPTWIRVTWEWDMAERRKARCNVSAVLRTENGNATAAKPLARSAQVVWRGDENAPGHDRAEADVPGMGRMAVVCEASPSGTRTLTIDAPEGASIRTREGGEDKLTETSSGPVVVPLPNNGQLRLGLAGGASVLVSSRWKVNDPRPGENSCRVAAMAVVE